MTKSVGRTLWVIADGYIPPDSHGPAPEMVSHETACLFDACDDDAHVRITLFFSDREPVGPYRVTVPARRTLHLRFDELREPEPVPRGTDYSRMSKTVGDFLLERLLQWGVRRVYAYPGMNPVQSRHLVDRAFRNARATRSPSAIVIPLDVQELDAVPVPPHKHATVHSTCALDAESPERRPPRRRGGRCFLRSSVVDRRDRAAVRRRALG